MKHTNRRFIEKKGLALLFCLLTLTWSLTGCKIERPEDVWQNDGSSIQQIESSNPGQQSLDESGDNMDSSIGSAEEGGSAPETSSSEASAPSSSEPGNSTSPKSPSSQGKDRYQTDPVPEGKPEPVEPGDAVTAPQKESTVTLSIVCTTILDNMDQFNMDKIGVLPRDGVIYTARKVTINEGESVFDLLLRETKRNAIHMEFRSVPMYNSNYIRGIHNLYEFDCGETSGWMYKVNGWFPNYGCSRYSLKDGDVVEWVYTCDLGKDVGCDWLENGQQGGEGS